MAESPQSQASDITISKGQLYSRKLRPDLSPNQRFYLNYQREHMSFYHYGLTLDCRVFVHGFLISEALKSDSLLHAVVAFAAYHHAVRTEGSTIQEFLPHYGSSLTCLREALKTRKPNVADLLTILQLAILEEFLGDWVTLAQHQKAAFSILTNLFTTDTMLKDDVANKILEWYIRFDLFVGFIAGTGATMSKDWFEAQYRYYSRQSRDNPADLGYKWDERNANARLLAKDVALLFAKKTKGLIDDADFTIQASDLGRRFAAWYREMPPALLDPSKVFKELSREKSVVFTNKNSDMNAEAVVYGGDLWPSNHMLAHFLGVEMMFNHQLAMMQHRSTPTDVATMALKICQVFEAVEAHDPNPGALLGLHASISMASVFLSRVPELTMWFRKKQVIVEASGYVYPTKFRHRMSAAWGVDVSEWWLPNGEGQVPIMRQIRDFVEGRDTQPKDRITQELKDMSGIFEALKFNDE